MKLALQQIQFIVVINKSKKSNLNFMAIALPSIAFASINYFNLIGLLEMHLHNLKFIAIIS